MQGGGGVNPGCRGCNSPLVGKILPKKEKKYFLGLQHLSRPYDGKKTSLGRLQPSPFMPFQKFLDTPLVYSVGMSAKLENSCSLFCTCKEYNTPINNVSA